MTDSYIYIITALLPLTACMVVFQKNPYHALIIRGILGAVAALVYAVLGAADVALTEALVGTMLAITLYAVAVRSSLVVRLGVLQTGSTKPDSISSADEGTESYFETLVDSFRSVFAQHYMRLELVPYADSQGLHQALTMKDVHAICVQPGGNTQPFQTLIRIPRLYEMMQAELSLPATILTYVESSDSQEVHL